MGLAGLFEAIGSLLANCGGGTGGTLVRRDELYTAVAVPVVVPVDKHRHLLACLVFAGKGPPGGVSPVFDRTEQEF